MRKDRFTDGALRNAYALGALKYSENPEDQQAFAEAYDFMTCERPDGSRYGTAGQCRKGKPVKSETRATSVKAGKSPVADVKPQKEKLNQVVNQRFLNTRDARELQDVLDNRQINKSQRSKIEAALAERDDEVKRVRSMDDETLKKHIKQLESEHYLATPRYNNARRNLERAKLARLPERVKEAQEAFDKVREESNKNYRQQREAKGEQRARLLGKATGPSAKPQTRNAAGLTKEEYEKQMAAMQAKAAPKVKSKKATSKGAGEALDALATRANRAKATGTYVNKSTLEKMIKLADETGRKIKYERMPNGNFNVYVQKGS